MKFWRNFKSAAKKEKEGEGNGKKKIDNNLGGVFEIERESEKGKK